MLIIIISILVFIVSAIVFFNHSYRYSWVESPSIRLLAISAISVIVSVIIIINTHFYETRKTQADYTAIVETISAARRAGGTDIMLEKAGTMSMIIEINGKILKHRAFVDSALVGVFYSREIAGRELILADGGKL